MSYTGFKNLGSLRYKRALHLLKQNTTGIFTKKQGYDVNATEKLTKIQKQKIRRYWKQYDKLTNRPHEPVSIKNKQKLRDVQIATGQTHYIGKFNKAYIQTDGKTIPAISYDSKKRVVLIKKGRLTSRFFKFDPALLATDTKAAITKLFNQATNAKMFKIKCGEYEYNKRYGDSISYINQLVQEFQNKYANHADWLKGLEAYYYDEYNDFRDDVNAIERGRELLKTKRKALKRQNMKKPKNRNH